MASQPIPNQPVIRQSIPKQPESRQSMSVLPVALLLTFLLMWPATRTFAQSTPKFMYQDPHLALEQRVGLLVSEMTLEEKISQMLHTAPAIPRLGVPAYNWWNEALHGVARAGYATVFPQSITIAGSWDRELMLRVATAISDEARAKHHEMLRRGKRGIYQGLTFWSPNINIFRDPRWGRGHETYGEDPYLTGEMGVQFVKGLQGDDPDYLKTVATAKHFAVHSGPEPVRHAFNVNIGDRDLFETYLPAFRKLVMDGKVWSVMCAYNQFRDHPACANPYLYNILRKEWGFEGYIVSDCWAISDFYTFQNYSKDAAQASAVAVKAGTDINCGVSYSALGEAVKRGVISESAIDTAVSRLFTARFRLGMFDPDDMVHWAQIPFAANSSDHHNTLAREAALKSIVLLKNDHQILPLSRDIKSIAVIGPNADNADALLGNYNGIPRAPITILEGLRNRLEPRVKILYTPGSHPADGIHNLEPIPSCYLMTAEGKQGVTGAYFANARLEGQPAFVRTDDHINFYWESGSPTPELPDDDFSIRWIGYLAPPVTGTYHLASWGMPGLDVWLEGEKILTHNSDHHGYHLEKAVTLEAGKKYKFVYEYKNWHGDGDARLLWAMPDDRLQEKAVELARQADLTVLVLGLSQRLEGEEMPVKVDGFNGGDRTHLNLPATQEALIKALAATDKPVVVVLLNGSALSVNLAAETADAILTAGYPGQQGGHAVADVLLGEYNPAGRLPVTWYKSVDQLPPFENYDMTGRTYRYFTGEPLWPFGFGLSYTTFGYSDLKVPEKLVAGEPLTVSVKVTNTGEREGEEVVQLYLTDEKASTPRPIRQLEGFERISLKPGESKVVSFTLEPRQLSLINKKDQRVIEPGGFTIAVGGKQPGFTGHADASTTQVLTTRFLVTGKDFPIPTR
jgi:beta-glucosidase